MIKVMDEVTGTAIKIEVVGKPYCYQVRVGKVGTWKIARGRTAGQIKSGEKWGLPMYFGTLEQVINGAIEEISEKEGIPTDKIVLAGSPQWEALINEEKMRINLVQKIQAEFNHLIEKYGKELSVLSKSMAKDESVSENEEADEEIEEENKTDFPKLEARMAEANRPFANENK